MTIKKFGLITRASDPTKLGKAVREGIVTELQEDKRAGLSYFESTYTKTELKKKLGVIYDSDILEIKVENNMADPIRKIKIDVPILRPQNYERLKIYVNDIKTFKEIMKWSDEEIIFASLTRSDLTELRMCMSDEQQTDLQKFISFLYSNYGISESKIWTELREIKQKNHESPLAFWHRLINLYYQARGSSKPAAITEISQQKEIQNLYLNGLLDDNLRLHVLTREIQFDQLASEVNKVHTVLNELKSVKNGMEVMHISSRGRSPHRSRSDFRNRSNSKSSERSSSERRCFRCGRKGHIRSQCHASRKTVNRYKKFLEDQGSRSRSQSRERRVTFEKK